MEKIKGKEQKRSFLSTIAKLFLKLGIIDFGGPAVHIALMQQEVVRKRHGVVATLFERAVAMRLSQFDLAIALSNH